MDKGSLAVLLAQGLSVAEIGRRFGKDPSTVSYWMEKHGLEAVHRDKHLARGGIERERLEALIEKGMTIAELAAELGLSTGTVRHWMRRYGFRTKNKLGPRNGARTRAAKDAGLVTVVRSCARHGETEFFLEGRGYYRCKRCRSEAVARRRRKVKATLVAEAGGRCCVCGYDRSVRALSFHHLDPSEKRMALAARGLVLSLDTMRAEAQKCVLLCANCHAEVEAGIISLSLE
jgi:transposase-like protein